MNEFTRYLWYIFPGSIVLFTIYFCFLIEDPSKFDFSDFRVGFILFAFIAGMIIHQFYRGVYHICMFHKRPQIELFIKKINEKYDIKNKGEFSLIKLKDKKIVDPLYTVLINGNKEYKSFCERMYNLSFYINFLGTSIVAFIISILLLIFILLNCFDYIPLILLIIILIVVCLLIYLFNVNLKSKNEAEVAFISLKYKEFLPKKTEIKNMIDDIRWSRGRKKHF